MRYFTISKKGRKGYSFTEVGYTYELNVDMFGKLEEFLIYADNRQAAIKSAEVIVSTITFESNVRTVQTEVSKQNGLQQLNLAYKMLETHEDKEKVLDYIKRLKAHFNIVDEVMEEVNAEETQATQTEEVRNEVNNVNEVEVIEKQYIAYNRTFSTYEEAVTYCNECDFDSSHIISNPSRQTLELDLQLFATDTIVIDTLVLEEPIQFEQLPQKPFKQPFATYKNGVSKFGIGKYLDLVYTIETTGTNPILDEINYSNIQQHQRDSIQDALNLFNLFQKQGYHNIQLWTEVRYKGNTVIENGSEGQLEFTVNDSKLTKAKQTEKDNEALQNKIELYERFIAKYNASDMLKRFTEEESAIQ